MDAYSGESYKLPTITCKFPLNSPVPVLITNKAENIQAKANVPLPNGNASRTYPANMAMIPIVTILPYPNLSAKIPPMNGKK